MPNPNPAASEHAPLPAPATGRFIPLLLLVSLPLYVLDQATKWLVVHRIDEAIAVVPGWFDLVSVTNTGAAWGMFKDSNTAFSSCRSRPWSSWRCFIAKGPSSTPWLARDFSCSFPASSAI